MSSRIKKDIRNSLTEWALAALLVVTPAIILTYFGWHREEVLPFHLAFLAIAASWLGAAILGKDISLGMLSYALAHVESRGQLWNEKLTTAGTQVGLLLLLSLACLVFIPEAGTTSSARSATLALAICTAGVGGGIFYSLILRSYQGAFWFALLIPTVIGVLLSTVPFFANRLLSTSAFVAIAYAMSLIYLSRKTFLKWEDLGPWGGEIWLSRILKRSTSSQTQQRHRQHRPISALVQKEFNLQQLNLLITASLIIIYIIALTLTGADGKPTNTSMMLAGFIRLLLLAFLPLAIGAIAVAEERRLRLSEWQQTLPVSSRLHWCIKLSVVYLVSLLGTALPPILIDWFNPEGWNRLLDFPPQILICLGLIIPLIATTIGIYTSSFSSSFLLAIGTSVVVILGIGAFSIGGVNYLTRQFGSGGMTPPAVLFAICLILILLPCLNVLSYLNARSRSSSKAFLARNGIGALVFALTTLAVTHWVYVRGWEQLTYHPPAPGTPQISETVTPTIIPGTWATVLAPNGTLWTSHYQSQQYVTNGSRSPVMKQIGSASDWAQAIGGLRNVYLIKQDGRLFTIRKYGKEATLAPIPFPDPTPEVGWRRVFRAVGGRFVLASKEDGTLWRWKEDERGELSEPTPFLTHRKWLSVARDSQFQLAVAEDGTLWAWGTNTGPSQWLTQHPVSKMISQERVALFPAHRVADLTDPSIQQLLEQNKDLLERLKIDITDLDDVGAPSRYLLARHKEEKIDETPFRLGQGQDWASVRFTDRTTWHISRNDGNRTPARILIATKKDGSKWTWNSLSFQAWGLQQPDDDQLFVPFETELVFKQMKFDTIPRGQALLVLTEGGQLLERDVEIRESQAPKSGNFLNELSPISERRNWLAFERDYYSTVALSNDGLLWQAGPYGLNGTPISNIYHVIPPSQKLRPVFDFNSGTNF